MAYQPNIQQIMAQLHDPYAASAQWSPVLSNIVAGINDPSLVQNGQRQPDMGYAGRTSDAARWMAANPGQDYFLNGPGAGIIGQNNGQQPVQGGQPYVQPPISMGPQQPSYGGGSPNPQLAAGAGATPGVGTPAGLSSIMRATGSTPWASTVNRRPR